MKRDIMKNILLSGILLVLGFTITGAGNPLAVNPEQPAQESFDLIVYGKNLHFAELEVMLKSNPTAGSQWTDVLEIMRNKDKVRTAGENKLLIIQGLSAKRYFGQDIRENYIAVRFQSHRENPLPKISAVYAFPSENKTASGSLKEYINWIENHPQKMESLSLASHVRPRPYLLKAGEVFTEHVEAPVRKFKPGLREVEWLKILFQ